MQTLNKAKILEYLVANLPNFKTRYNVEKIGLFGSYVRGEETQESDIDLYAHFSKKNLSSIAGLWIQIENDLNKKIDIVTAHPRINPVLLDSIKKEVVYA